MLQPSLSSLAFSCPRLSFPVFSFHFFWQSFLHALLLWLPLLRIQLSSHPRVRCSSGCLGKKASRDQRLHCRAFLGDAWPCNLFLKVEKETPFMGCQNRSETAHHIMINTFFLPFPYSSFLFANQHLLCSLSLLFLPSFCPFIACLFLPFLRAFLFLFFLHGIQLSSHAWARCSNSGCLDKSFRILHWLALRPLSESIKKKLYIGIKPRKGQ